MEVSGLVPTLQQHQLYMSNKAVLGGEGGQGTCITMILVQLALIIALHVLYLICSYIMLC